MALRTCTVKFTGPSGVPHSVELTAESIYEAAALGVSALQSDGWADAIAPGTELEVQVREPATSSAHGAADSSLVRWSRGQPGRDAEATIEANARLGESAAS